MKKLAIITAFIFALAQTAAAQKQEKAKLAYDSTAKVLTRTRFIEVSEVIDTARLYQEQARLLAEIEKVSAQLDSVKAQIKEARKLMTGKKGGGKNRAAEAPPVLIFTAPECDSTYTIENGPVIVCWYDGVIRNVSYSKPPQKPKTKATKPKSKAKKQ